MEQSMKSEATCRNRKFSESDASVEIKISISHGHDEELLFNAVKECVQKWNRRAEKRGDSRVGYCIELARTTNNSCDR